MILILRMRQITAGAWFVIGLLAVAANAAEPKGLAYGNPWQIQFKSAEEQQRYYAGRTVVITPTTDWVNVRQDDVIHFVIVDANGQQKSFDWEFDTLKPNFELNKIAPSDVLIDHKITVYIEPKVIMDESGSG